MSADSSPLDFTLDATAVAPTLAFTDSGVSDSDGLTNDGTVTVSDLEPDASWEYSTDGGGSWIAGFDTSVMLSDDGPKSVLVRQTDAAGNVSAESTQLDFMLDATAPSLTIAPPASGPNPATGAVTFDFIFSEAVTGFNVNEIAVVNGSKGTLTSSDGIQYALDITPTSSATPLIATVDVPAGAATDTTGNASTAAAQFLQSVLFGTSGADTLTVGDAQDFIFLGAGNDVLKLAAVTGSTADATDDVADFATGDKIDLTVLLGSSGAGYAESALGDTGTGFVELKNVTLTKLSSTTRIDFDVTFDSASYEGSKISGAVIDLTYNYGSVTSAQVNSATYSYTDAFGEPTTGNVWPLIVSNMSGASGNGAITLAAFTDTTNTPLWQDGTNPIVSTGGKTISVRLLVNGLVDTFGVGFDNVQIVATDQSNVDHNFNDVSFGVSKTAGVTIGTTGVLEIVTDTGTLGSVGDNQLHMLATYNSGVTHLEVQYDTNSAFGSGQITASDLIAMDFEGDVTANLVPASLTFI